MNWKNLTLLFTGLLLGPIAANANIIVLDFEGIADQAAVGDFYNGGGGTNHGIEFSPDTLAAVDEDAGGNGNFANEPSADTVMFFLASNTAILNFANGFNTGFSFFYSSSTDASVDVYDGVNATGNLLGSLNLVAQFSDTCSGDPTGSFCNWDPAGISFMGNAKSIGFGGTANFTGFDDITFGSTIPGGPRNTVPAPGTLALFSLALGLLRLRYRRA